MARSDTDEGKTTTGAKPRPVGEVAVGLLVAARRQDILFLASDEVRASEIARAAEAGAGDILVLLVPGSDALPGDSSPPSPATLACAPRARKLRRAAELQRTSVC